jgi:hypothetical protein
VFLSLNKSSENILKGRGFNDGNGVIQIREFCGMCMCYDRIAIQFLGD